MRIGNKEFDIGKHTYIMGILNVTPDSFWDGGRFLGMDRSLTHVAEMINDGADIIDVGGESTRPGYKALDAADEIERVMPVIEAIKDRFDIPISLDTYKNTVAWAGIGAGADMINDIWGLKGDDKMADVVSGAHVPVCIMHNRKNANYRDFMTDVISDLKESLSIAENAGIAPENIMLDPGVGFAKDRVQNLEVMAHMDEIASLGYPVLLGVSRKSVIGDTLKLPLEERLEGSLATSAWGMMHGATFIRVHDVKEHRRLVDMMEAIRDAQ
ncbi:MAG: dihydropteroate synthase [Lachnospiraceae bacterium]|nr:dihydropteroate synthase [Lachnospiraceae bacterium]